MVFQADVFFCLRDCVGPQNVVCLKWFYLLRNGFGNEVFCSLTDLVYLVVLRFVCLFVLVFVCCLSMSVVFFFLFTLSGRTSDEKHLYEMRLTAIAGNQISPSPCD